ncbi:hypothetical protein NECAME_10678 [Necator americanus]|uniref:Uncharacterized protein n=1 Tax=Necator americanus TaxID=51031 RepID=W2TAB3_NECAM|nr:hypothetical protein NECAME_10678 [Necator americanus]ETN77947.1 hypothetical protein NECAME_10678 [Necator americanus]
MIEKTPHVVITHNVIGTDNTKTAHTDEFCLSSMGGVNCYVFSPVCSDTSSTMAFAKHRKSKRRAFLNKN